MSLFACSPADVTLERVRELVGQDLPESLTLEYRERYSPSLVKSVAAMANSYGGLVLVGVKDQPGPERLAGLPEQAVVQIVDACHQKLEPPWQPELIPVRMTDDAVLPALGPLGEGLGHLLFGRRLAAGDRLVEQQQYQKLGVQARLGVFLSGGT